MRRRQIYAERYPSDRMRTKFEPLALGEETLLQTAALLSKSICDKCGKDFKNVGAHRRFCKG